MRNALLIALTLFAGSISVYADQPNTPPQSTARFGARRPAQQDPYARLFEVREALKQAQQQVAPAAPQRKTVCGMTIIEADPFFDQKMKVAPPRGPNVKYTIRAIEPSTCK